MPFEVNKCNFKVTGAKYFFSTLAFIKNIKGRCRVAFNILRYTKFSQDIPCRLCLTTLPQRKMSIITYILIFVYLKANGYFKKTCSVTNACT